MNASKHTEKIQKEFSKQAAYFADPGLTLSSQEYLDWMVRLLPLHPEFRVLDVASGTGHLGRAIAPWVREVIGIDVTPAMLTQARKESTKARLENIRFQEGDATAIPYKDASFDMVVCRLAVHHFEQPLIQINEMVRVCKPGHVIGIIDLLSPSDPTLIEVYNRLEKLRDPSHVKALTKDQLIETLKTAGISVQRIETRDIHVDFQKWFTMANARPENKQIIYNELIHEIRDGNKTGMRPYLRENTLMFTQLWCIAMGKNIQKKYWKI
ncbi:MAG: class I SAM-dependent methyltransferase [Candidatus Competibacterales bacterium]|nr:class I SAM-dependent methyltransferase [Candidatus Competibacterales bacterium]